MGKRNHELVIHVDPHLTLHVGRWEELTEGDGTCYRMVYPPKQTLFDQILLYLETIVAQSPRPSTTQLTLSEQVRAILAVCLRWGSCFAVLADEAKTLWPMTNQQKSISLIADAEMARINIETLAALEQWLNILRSDKEHYLVLVLAAKQLPLPLKRIIVPPRQRERLLEWAIFAECMRSLAPPQERSQLIASRGEADWVEQIQQKVLAHPTRMLANGIINMCWRNGSSIENFHAGAYAPRPLFQRRITPQQEQILPRETGEMLAVALEIVLDLIDEQSGDS
ncbi:hypothetical protein [Ktedonobacter robiniae]|uniref:Uncharacterized protein n=1 Tax=Ktedonobacter robiniae TaxID=2778365 RepID=A0ABQ3V2X2_9CHLR|nr:hypothetical protein [Ktedonobacter robiniae]GHO59268.1 hypothetical protein KSB_77430 [Ktedonobacter robiniae]